MNRPTRLAALLALAALALPASAKTYYVKTTGADVKPTTQNKAGLSEGTAFRTIQFAIDNVAAGSTILVYPGTYEPINSKNKKVTIKAVEGPYTTTIDGSDGLGVIGAELGVVATKTHYYIDSWGRRKSYKSKSFFGNNTSLRGFEITRCSAAVRGGSLADCRVVGNTNTYEYDDDEDWVEDNEKDRTIHLSKISDCIVRNNTAETVVGDTPVTRCEISGNTATGWGGVVYYGNVLCSLVSGNTGVSILYSCGNVYNSTIVDNFVTSDGGAANGCNVFDCILWGNRTTPGGDMANVRLAVDAKTGATVASDYMNYTEEWYDDWEEEWEYWDHKPWNTMMNSDVEGIVVEQKGNKRYYKNSTGNVSVDPCFLYPEAGDYRLKPWSPCVDAGADYTKKTGKYDLVGVARKVVKVDMGAFELPAATPVPADYDGDGFTDPALYFPATGEWWIWGEQTLLGSGEATVRREGFGAKGAIPLAADFDGDGHADPAFFAAADSVPYFAYLDAGGFSWYTTFGTKGATPVAAKFSAGGAATFGVYTANAKKPEFRFEGKAAIPFGATGAKPVVADFTGDGKDDLGVYTASASKPAFSVLQSDKNYSTALPFEIPSNPFYPTARKSIPLGTKGSTPCVADYDGDGRADFATYSATAAAPAFTRLLSSTKYSETRTLPMGRKGNVPVCGVYEAANGPASPAVWTGKSWSYVDSSYADVELLGE